MRGRWQISVPATILTAGVLCAGGLALLGSQLRQRAELRLALRCDDPQTRKQAAWTIADRADRALETDLIDRLGVEPRADVREALVYALGVLGDRRSFGVVEATLDSDPSGYVRAAAWLAAARIDPAQFRILARAAGRPEDAWDRVGVAQGWLSLGDVRGVEELLAVAGTGEAAQRHVACRALAKWLRPLLEAVGRWPLEAAQEQVRPWPPELVAEIRRRCAGLDMQALADQTRRWATEGARVRRLVNKLNRARDGLAAWLSRE